MKRLAITIIFILSLSIQAECQENKYFVTFYAYAAGIQDGVTPGHVIIAFGYEDFENSKSVSDGAWGFYPKGTVTKIANLFFDGDVQTGIVKSDVSKWLQKDLIEARVSKVVSQEKYSKALAIIDQWKSNEDYHILRHSCVHFGAAIAKAIDMNVPDDVDLTFPETFLNNLASQN